MTTGHQTIHYHLAAAPDVEQLLDEMGNIDAGTIVISFDSSADNLSTDLQFARLVAAARDHEQRLIIESGDRELVDRAMRMGFDDLAVVSDAPVVEFGDTNTIAPVILPSGAARHPGSRFDTTDSLATYRPVLSEEHEEDNAGIAADQENDPLDVHRPPTEASEAETTVFNADREYPPNENGEQDEDDAGKDVTDMAASWALAGMAQPRRRPTAVDADREEADRRPDDSRSRPKRQRRSRRRRGLILAAAIVSPLLVLAVVGALVVYLLPTAEVTIVPVEDTITSSLTYGVRTADANLDIAVDPTPISNGSTAEATREATGERFEPDGTAAGSIQITNPFTSEVTVPAGTDINAANGVTYYTAEDVVIPAADPFGSLSFGSASVGIYAGIAGPDGNLGAGVLTGQLGTGLFYTNPSDISGGTMRSITVIDEEDLIAVAGEVEEELLDKAEREFLATIPEGMELIPGSVEIRDPEIEVIGEAGEDGEQVSASGTISVRGQIFDPEELHERAHEEAGRLLARQGGSERIVIARLVTIADPTPLNDDQTAFTVRADGTARTVISDAEKQELIDQLVGLSRADAEALLAAHPKVDRFELIIEPDWLPDRLPEVSSRIELHVSSSGQPTATR
jgi:hypothetical protein